MTPIKHSIIQLLMPVLLETTRRARPTDPPEVDPKMSEVFSKWHGYVDEGYMNFVAEALEAITGKKLPRRADGSGMPPIFTVVVPTEDNTSHHYAIGVPHIVIHQANGQLLEPHGRHTHISRLECAIATDEQVEECLHNLSEFELRYILTGGIFAPILAPLFLEQEPVKEAK